MVFLVAMFACTPLLFLSVMAVDRQVKQDSKFANWRLIDFCEVGSAWFLGMIFLSGGMSKLMPFPGVIGPVWLEEALAEHGLGLFARFIAWSEAAIGLLVLTKQTRVLGAIMLVPLLLNILMVTVSMQWRGTPWVIMFFIANNLFLLAFHFDRWRSVVDSSVGTVRPNYVTGPRFGLRIAIGCMLLMLVAPGIFTFAGAVAVIPISIGLVGMVWLEWQSRFNVR